MPVLRISREEPIERVVGVTLDVARVYFKASEELFVPFAHNNTQAWKFTSNQPDMECVMVMLTKKNIQIQGSSRFLDFFGLHSKIDGV